MAEPRPKSGSFQIHVSYSFDRLLEPKLAQAYDILVPGRERPVGVHVKEFDDENGGHLRTSLVRATARGEHHCAEIEGVVDSISNDPRYGTTHYKLQSVKRDEPSPELFVPPPPITKWSWLIPNKLDDSHSCQTGG